MELLIEEYLRSTSILAQKIAQDLDAAREAYQDIWNTLNEKEQKQVLDEAIIDPAAVLKYSNIKNIVSMYAFSVAYAIFNKQSTNKDHLLIHHEYFLLEYKGNLESKELFDLPCNFVLSHPPNPF